MAYGSLEKCLVFDDCIFISDCHDAHHIFDGQAMNNCLLFTSNLNFIWKCLHICKSYLNHYIGM